MNCNASVINNYNVTALSHNQTKTFYKTVNITWWTNTYAQAFVCNWWALSTSWSQTITSTSCLSGYTKSGTTCSKVRTYYLRRVDGNSSIQSSCNRIKKTTTSSCNASTYNRCFKYCSSSECTDRQIHYCDRK
jgi:hypothetical protein